jgi:hypothetical protein
LAEIYGDGTEPVVLFNSLIMRAFLRPEGNDDKDALTSLPFGVYDQHLARVTVKELIEAAHYVLRSPAFLSPAKEPEPSRQEPTPVVVHPVNETEQVAQPEPLIEVREVAKRGPKAKVCEHRVLRGIVERDGSDWRNIEYLKEVAAELDRCISRPEQWGTDTWEKMINKNLGKVIKVIDGRLKTLKRYDP